MMHKKISGFTLAELLISVVVIGLLASTLSLMYAEAVRRGRDAQRLADMQVILLALEAFRIDHGHYPDESDYGESEAWTSGWDTSLEDNDNDGYFFLDPLIVEGYLQTDMLDPINANLHQYRYHRYEPGDSACPVNTHYFVLGIIDMETIEDGTHHPDSPGWTCPARDWHNEFEWVTGGFDGVV